MTKLAIYIYNPEDFLKGEIAHCFNVVPKEHWDWWDNGEANANSSYTLVKVIDIDLDSVSRDLITQKAINALDKRETEIRAKSEAEITELERRKAELLSIPFIPEAS